MSSKFRRLMLTRAARLFDLVAVCLTFLTAFVTTSGAFTWDSVAEVLAMRIKLSNLLIFAMFVGFWSIVFAACGFYISHRLSHWSRQVREVLLAVSLIVGLLLISKVPLDFQFATDRFLFVFWSLSIAILILPRFVGRKLLDYARSNGRNLRRVVLVGEGPGVRTLADQLEREATLGYRVVRIIEPREVQK